MYCSKCNNKLNSEDKFCTKCGTPVESNVNVKISNNENKYTIKKDYNIMWGMVSLAIIVELAFWIAGVGFSMSFIIVEFVLYGILVVAGAFSNLLFKCPNCKEEITLAQNQLKVINDNESKCQCSKCNKELIFNNKDFSVRINNKTENIEQNDSNNNATNKLEELYNLKTKGIITEEEYENKKQDLLNKI